ncbi:unnamed protein product [Effrenium voratum]|uniref:Yippee domain-containing protein n=1 Tax=Effrenium voratum TaxID=2562239 RepID=A0AA36NF71_9DINO|nr:unnamed protein product [Effrenium voratum]
MDVTGSDDQNSTGCYGRSRLFLPLEMMLRTGGVKGANIYEQLLELAQVRLAPGLGLAEKTPITTHRWRDFLQELHSRGRMSCAPAAALLFILRAELLWTSLLADDIATCRQLRTAAAQAEAQAPLEEYPSLRAAADAVMQSDGWQPWREALRVGEQMARGAFEVMSRWRWRCGHLTDRSQVALACWQPFLGPVPGEQHACVAGLSPLGRASPGSFYHFTRGLLVEAFRILRSRFGSFRLRLALGDLTYPCDHRHNFMDFFGAFLDHPVTVDPGCELSRRRNLPVLGLPFASRSFCELRAPLRAAVPRTGASAPVFLLLRRNPAGTPTRAPTNQAAVTQVCKQSRLSCRDLALEDLSWARQLLLLRRTKALVGSHGSGVGAAMLWLPSAAAVLEFMPRGCWWCAFAVGAALPNCTSRRAQLTLVISTTADTPPASPHRPHPLIGCADGEASTFGLRRDLRRHVALRGFHVLRAVLRRGPRAARGLRHVQPACAGAALQVYEGKAEAPCCSVGVARAGAMAWMWEPAAATYALRRLSASDALDALTEMTDLQVEVNVIHVSSVIAVCSKEAAWQQASALLLGLGAAKLRADVVVFNSALRAQALAVRWQAALQLLPCMLGQMMTPNSKSTSIASSACASAALWQESVALAKDPDKDVVPGNTAIHACGRSFAWHKALQMSEAMKMGLELDQVAQAAALNACVASSSWQQAVAMGETFEEKAVPDVVLHSSLMTAYAEGILWQESLRLLHDMAVKRCSPDQFSFSNVISTCESAGQWQWALWVFDCLQQEFLPNVVAYTAAMTAARDWRQVLDLLRKMLQHESPNERTLMAAMDACAKGRQWSTALCLLAGSWRWRIKVSQASYTVALGACSGNWQRALSLVYGMPMLALPPNEITLSAATGACERSSCWALAVRLLSSGAPCLLRLGTAIGACEDVAQWRMALALHSSQVEVEGEDEQRGNGRNAALSACAAAGRWRRAMLTLERVCPTTITFNSLLNACEKGGQWLQALRIMGHMGYRRHAKADKGIQAAVLSCTQLQQWKPAAELLEQLEAPVFLADGYAAVASLARKGPLEDSVMTTGLHTIRCLFCVVCQERVGWKYEVAFEEDQKYKEGRFILEEELLSSSIDFRLAGNAF